MSFVINMGESGVREEAGRSLDLYHVEERVPPWSGEERERNLYMVDGLYPYKSPKGLSSGYRKVFWWEPNHSQNIWTRALCACCNAIFSLLMFVLYISFVLYVASWILDIIN